MIRNAVKTLLRSVGFDLVRYIEMPSQPFDVLGAMIRECLGARSKPFVLQIGANDGMCNDPLHTSIVEHGLAGLLVEPQPDLFAALKANYAGCANLQFAQCAVGRCSGTATLYRVRPEVNQPGWMNGIASLNREHFKQYDSVGSQYSMEEIVVPCLSMADLLKEYQIQHVDLLQVDVEGFDCALVRMAVELGLRPTIINYEFIHAPPAERAACKQLLFDTGYGFIDVGRDTLAVRLAEVGN